MVGKIEFFDNSNVGDDARRLAFCFNVSARMIVRDGNPLSYAEELYKTSTGKNVIPAFNEDEQEFLKLSLVETAAIRDRGEIFSIDNLAEKASLLHLAAPEMGLIRKGLPHTKPGGDEAHMSFPGA